MKQKLKTILVSNTTERQLSWLVGIAMGRDWSCGGMYNPICNFNDEYANDGGDYANNWNLCGPIIERERISLKENVPAYSDNIWNAFPSSTAKGAGGKWGVGPTPLIAAMRCYVASKLGDRVEIPEELT